MITLLFALQAMEPVNFSITDLPPQEPTAKAPAEAPKPAEPWELPKLDYRGTDECVPLRSRQLDQFGTVNIGNYCPQPTSDIQPFGIEQYKLNEGVPAAGTR